MDSLEQMGRINLWSQPVYVQFREEVDPFREPHRFRPLNRAYTGDNTFWSVPSPEPELKPDFWEQLKSNLNNPEPIRQAASRLADSISQWEPQNERIVFAAILRAGVPIADWLCRLLPGAAAVSISLFVGLGVDRTAIEMVKADYPGRRLVFVDGWTGKGGVARELKQLGEGPLAVLIDPWGWADFSGTRKDIFCPTACFTGAATLGFSRTFCTDNQRLFSAYLFPERYTRPDVVKTWQDRCPSAPERHYLDTPAQPPFFSSTNLRFHSNEVCRALINAAPDRLYFLDDPWVVKHSYPLLLTLAEIRKVRVAYHATFLADYKAAVACSLIPPTRRC